MNSQRSGITSVTSLSATSNPLSDEKEPEVKIEYDVQQSIEFIESWPEKKKGYRELGGFCLFMLLYIVMLALQLQVGSSYVIDSAFRKFLGGDSLKGIATHSDFWEYLVSSKDNDTGVLPFLFNNKWYNGAAYTTAEQGYILEYNKLVGGVLIVQSRGDTTNDGCSGVLGNTAYDQFYQTCYSSSESTTQYNTTADSTTASSFQYSDEFQGFPAFFSVAESKDLVLARARKLKAQRWTDKQTRSISIKFAFYNGNFGLFSFSALDFDFSVTGIFRNGNHLTIQSINMEPYRSAKDYVRAAIECIVLMWVAQQFTHFLRVSLDLMNEIDEDTGVRKGPGALLNLWTAVDTANLSLFFAYIVFRLYVLQMTYRNVIVIPTNKYESILEEVSLVQNQQLVVNFLNIFIGLLRFFKYYQFQAKLNVLNKTFAYAFVDLYHFLIMFGIIFGGYAVMGHILFGPTVHDYSSIGRSLQTCWQMILGQFDYPSMEKVNPDMAAIFFITFMFLVLIVLVNILLAILIDAYTKATQDQEGMSILNEIGKGVLKGLNVARGYNRDFQDKDIVEALHALKERGYARATAQDVGKLVVRKLRKRNPQKRLDETYVGDIISEHPLLHFVDFLEEQETAEEMEKTHNFPKELVDNIESILRENVYLRKRVGIVDPQLHKPM